MFCPELFQLGKLRKPLKVRSNFIGLSPWESVVDSVNTIERLKKKRLRECFVFCWDSTKSGIRVGRVSVKFPFQVWVWFFGLEERAWSRNNVLFVIFELLIDFSVPLEENLTRIGIPSEISMKRCLLLENPLSISSRSMTSTFSLASARTGAIWSFDRPRSIVFSCSFWGWIEFVRNEKIEVKNRRSFSTNFF